MAFMGTSVHKTWYINTLDNYTIFVSRSCWPVKTGGLNSTLDISLSCNSLRICEIAATLNDHLFQRDWALGEITIEYVWCPCSWVSQNIWREKSQTVCRWVPCVETHIPNWFRMFFWLFFQGPNCSCCNLQISAVFKNVQSICCLTKHTAASAVPRNMKYTADKIFICRLEAGLLCSLEPGADSLTLSTISIVCWKIHFHCATITFKQVWKRTPWPLVHWKH